VSLVLFLQIESRVSLLPVKSREHAVAKLKHNTFAVTRVLINIKARTVVWEFSVVSFLLIFLSKLVASWHSVSSRLHLKNLKKIKILYVKQ
jgi:hypothetical protein